jgi:hypothetical protein
MIAMFFIVEWGGLIFLRSVLDLLRSSDERMVVNDE